MLTCLCPDQIRTNVRSLFSEPCMCWNGDVGQEGWWLCIWGRRSVSVSIISLGESRRAGLGDLLQTKTHRDTFWTPPFHHMLACFPLASVCVLGQLVSFFLMWMRWVVNTYLLIGLLRAIKYVMVMHAYTLPNHQDVLYTIPLWFQGTGSLWLREWPNVPWMINCVSVI